MKLKHDITIEAPVDSVFSAYENIQSWIEWDSEVSDVELEAGLILGSKGMLKPKSGPRASIEVVEVTPLKSFTVQSNLPLCIMRVGHELEPNGNQTRTTHWVSFSGPMTFLFRFLIGRPMANNFSKTLAGLKTYCEK